ncbi:MAG: sugar transferase [Candidatus Paceibacterota bacterium]|jgi:lipopolysaccharide/colanic/teichoic acid biosynthesis glycosyltransferase
MITGGRRTPLLLLLGDLVAFSASLYLTLWLRYGALPDPRVLSPYLIPFAVLFVLWTLVFYSSGLYSKRVTLFPNRLPDTLIRTQVANILLAALFFFLMPAFGIAPKTILAVYLVVSLALVLFWRLVLHPHLATRRVRERAILLAQGDEAEELFKEVNGNPRYGIEFCSRELADAGATLLVADSHVPTTALVAFRKGGGQVVSFEDLYEEIFDRIPLSELGKDWFRKNVTVDDPLWYAFMKRCIDIVGGVVMGIVVIVLAPFLWIANRLEGKGPLFIAQERFGRYGARIIAYKFRSMTKNLAASGEWVNEGEAQNRVTKVGSFLRTTSLDEFPQFINILKGELSLIGPRNDILGLGLRLAEALPYYEARYRVLPGITGWAQINQQYEQGNVSPQSIEETKVRLAYDFYYLKHRSLGLDILIALRTVKRMFFRMSS